MNYLVRSKELGSGCVVQLTDFMISNVRDRQVAIVLSLDILYTEITYAQIKREILQTEAATRQAYMGEGAEALQPAQWNEDRRPKIVTKDNLIDLINANWSDIEGTEHGASYVLQQLSSAFEVSKAKRKKPSKIVPKAKRGRKPHSSKLKENISL